MKHFLIALLAIIVLCPKLYAALFPDKGSWKMSPQQLELLRHEERNLYPIHLKIMEKKLETVMKKRQKALEALLTVYKDQRGGKEEKAVQKVLKIFGYSKEQAAKIKFDFHKEYRGGQPYRDIVFRHSVNLHTFYNEGNRARRCHPSPNDIHTEGFSIAESLAFQARVFYIWNNDEPVWSHERAERELSSKNPHGLLTSPHEQDTDPYCCPRDFEPAICLNPVKIPKDIPSILKEEDVNYDKAKAKIRQAAADTSSLPVKERVLKLIEAYAEAAEMGYRKAAADTVVLLKGFEQALRREGAWDDKLEKMLYSISRISSYYEANAAPTDMDVYPIVCYAGELMKEESSGGKTKEMFNLLNLADQRLYGPYCIMDGGMAAYLLGMCYLKGLGVTQNSKKAVYYFREGTIVGNADAANQLGLCYIDGNGVTQNKSLGKDCIKIAKRFRKYAPLHRHECTYSSYGKSAASLYLHTIREESTSAEGQELLQFLDPEQEKKQEANEPGAHDTK